MLPVGNKNIASRVAAFQRGKLPHAIMLEGERGLGKHTLAQHIASIAVCQGASAPCGECRGCHLCGVGSHPDVVTVSPDGKQLTVDKIRALRQNAYLKPTLCDRKVYIVECADTMNNSAQNALLKVLEEPPTGVVFILLVDSADSMLPTVRSRCITLSLTPPSRDEAAEYIASVTDKSAAEIDTALADAKNNIGVALLALSGKNVGGLAHLASELLLDINNSTSYEMLVKLKPYEKDRAAIDSLLSELLLRISHLLREGCYTHIKEGLTRAQLIKAYDAVVELKKSANSNANTMLLFTNLCSTLKSL
ncbi:MAG: DNA polymerase III subunit delta' [Clostridia bacterium]|nr:DNA polymerase III subunit delta' [Clostridia bacterium]